MNLHTSCDLDWTYWPWDRQKCHLVVGSWTKTGWELDVQNLGGANRTHVDMSNYAPSAWSLVSGTQQRRVYNDYAGTQDYYIDIDVRVVLHDPPYPNIILTRYPDSKFEVRLSRLKILR